MEIINIKIEELVPYGKNPRNNEISIDAVANSIKKFGFKVPIVIDKDKVIVCGHTRLKAAKKLGFIDVPCVYADDLTEDQIKAYRLADNKTAELSGWKMNDLDDELKDLSEFDMSMFGFPSAKTVEIESNAEETPDDVKMVKCPHCGKMVVAKKVKVTHESY